MTQTAMMILSAALAAITFTGIVTVEWVYLIALLFGIVTTLDNPSRQSFVGVIVPPRLLSNAVALNSGNFNLARLTGPALAGLLIAAAGVAWAFVINTLSYLPMIYALATLDSSEFEEAPARGAASGRSGRAWRTWPATRASSSPSCWCSSSARSGSTSRSS
ncbi:MFS transporter [Propioniciclava coleopterorum]|uniref:MFS transporter n=1 Tax=Propioniciclava coleopterorum TaxID=2714937 RepID=A0A6G7Y879_9ACTN|nr:MFS transporter [Propioniciclava coleopterorum]QIK72858.1 MFS transporter [Propioniciclava coleopterorum]